MKVLMTADTIGGVWHYALQLSEALKEYGVEVHLATMGREPDAEQRWAAERAGNVVLYPSAFKLEWMEDAWEDVDRAGEWLLELERRVNADIVHLNGYAHGALAFEAPVVVVGHSCVMSWWRAVRGGEAPAAWNEYRRRVKAGLRGADGWVAPTQSMMEAMVAHDGEPGGGCRSAVIYNGRSGKMFCGGTKRPRIFCAGRLWDEAKNAGAVARAAGTLAWPVYVAGDARDSGGALGAAKNVIYLGRLCEREMAEHMAAAEIFCHPARYEPFGLAVLEAALCGCALVLGDIPSLRELWGAERGAEEAADFVPPEDDQGLKRALQRLMDDPVRRRALGERARLRAARYSPQRMGKAYMEFYQLVGGCQQAAALQGGRASCAS